MSKKLIVATVAAGAGLAWYCRTPSGRQQAAATFNSVRHRLADWIKPADQVIEMNEVEEFLDANVAEIFDDSDVPPDFLDSIQPQQA
jgi:hypothetical protein